MITEDAGDVVRLTPLGLAMLRQALREIREAAQEVVDECSPTSPPSNGAVERLRTALRETEVLGASPHEVSP